MSNFEFTAIGTITSTPTLKTVNLKNRAAQVCSFELSIPRRIPKPDDNTLILKCSAWGDLAARIHSLSHAGDVLKISGDWISSGAYHRSETEAGASLECTINHAIVLLNTREVEVR